VREWAGPTRAGGISGELSPADLRSSNRASLPGRAEGAFSAELGSARVRKPGYQTAKIVKFSVGMGNAGLARATKHTLSSVFLIPQVQAHIVL
jgi:hypothetical protein